VLLGAIPQDPAILTSNEVTLDAHQFRQLRAVMNAAREVSDYSSLFEMISDFYKEIGAGAVNCAIFDNDGFEFCGVSTSMLDWAYGHYYVEGLAAHDPLVHRLRDNPEPAILGWGYGITAPWQNGQSPRILRSLQASGYHGLLYIPVRIAGGPFSATITLATRLDPGRARAYIENEYGLIYASAQFLGQRAAELFPGSDIGSHWHSFRHPPLTTREREVVALLIAGERPQQIAHRLEIKTVTVNMHIRSAKTKLRARTREQLVALARDKGMGRMPVRGENGEIRGETLGEALMARSS